MLSVVLHIVKLNVIEQNVVKLNIVTLIVVAPIQGNDELIRHCKVWQI